MDGFDQLDQINKDKADKQLAEQRHNDQLVSNIDIQETFVKTIKSLVDFLEMHTTKTNVLNFPDKIGTPDTKKVVDALSALHDTIRTHENVDLTESTNILKSVLEELRTLPREFPETKIPDALDYSDKFTMLEKALKVLDKTLKEKDLSVEAPIVNVKPTDVTVNAPDLKPLTSEINIAFAKAIKAIVIPEYKTDNKEVEKQLKQLNKSFDAFLKAPYPSSGGGGSGRVSPYQDSNSIPAFVTLSNGSIPVVVNPLLLLSKIDTTSTSGVTYIGKAAIGSSTASAVWQIKKLDTNTLALDKTWAGSGNFDNVWDNRATTVVYS